MTKLNEDDFLEKLMPYLRRGSEGGEDRCPDPESLVAFCEGTLYASRSEQIRDHFARCAACAEIHERLLHFESSFQPSQSQWLNAEKRLDNWMDSFLTAESLRAKENNKSNLWQRFWHPKALSRVRYGLAAAAMVLLVGVSMNLSRRSVNSPNTATVAPAQKVPVSPDAVAAKKANDEQLLASTPQYQLETEPHGVILNEGESASTPLSNATVSYAPAAGPFSSVRIEDGTNILARIVATKQGLDGSFSFQGFLIEPLRQKGQELFPAGTLVAGRGVLWLKELTIQILQLPAGVQLRPLDVSSAPVRPLDVSSAPTQYLLHESRANVTISGDASRNFSVGKTVEFRFVLRSKYQTHPSP
jgi:hypothetical protein